MSPEKPLSNAWFVEQTSEINGRENPNFSCIKKLYQIEFGDKNFKL